jgi:hypothetical protein
MELRNLVSIPFLSPHNMMNANNMRNNQAAAAAAAASTQRLSIATGAASLESNANNSSKPTSPTISTYPIKKQPSRPRMTPQQAAVAMANGMIAANMAAAVNGTANQNRSPSSAVQLALAGGQQQSPSRNGMSPST